jgi:2-polyprenyl-6-methoxyphenol hydroxylase-like FAD-dependent oxidoreductase
VRDLAFAPQRNFEQYLGYGVAAFSIVGYRPRDESVYVSYAIPGKQIARFALRGDRTMLLLIFSSRHPPGVGAHDTEVVKRLLHAQFDGAGWEADQIMSALDDCDDLYFDRVSQIHLPRWSQGRVALVGDAAFCPTLMAGQGAALAMVSANTLAGELGRKPDQPREALLAYERRLRAAVEAKQRAAPGFASSLVPSSRLGIALRNVVTKALSFPTIAKYALGASLVDPIELPTFAAECQRGRN